jgi:preprotein translocase subunit SecG
VITMLWIMLFVAAVCVVFVALMQYGEKDDPKVDVHAGAHEELPSRDVTHV